MEPSHIQQPLRSTHDRKVILFNEKHRTHVLASLLHIQ